MCDGDLFDVIQDRLATTPHLIVVDDVANLECLQDLRAALGSSSHLLCTGLEMPRKNPDIPIQPMEVHHLDTDRAEAVLFRYAVRCSCLLSSFIRRSGSTPVGVFLSPCDT